MLSTLLITYCRRIVCLAALFTLCCGPNASAQYAEQTGTNNPFDGITALSSANALDAVAGDFDSDGDIDLLAYDGSSERFYQNDGTATFTEQTGAQNPFDGVALVFGTRGRTFVGDVDGDTDTDIVDFRPATGTFAFIENTDGSTYTDQTGTNNPFDGIQVSGNQTSVDAVFGDFDTDDDIDLLVFDGSTERYYENDGSGTFTEQTGASNPFDGIAQAFWTNTTTLVRDFDGDGDVDLASRDGSASGTAAWIYMENTDGSTYADRSGAAFPLDNVAVDATQNSVAITTGDFNLDGSLDLLAYEGTSQTFYAGDGAGTYTAQTGTSNPFDGVTPALQVFATTLPVNVNPVVDDDIDITFGENDALRFIERTGQGVIPVELARFNGQMDGDAVQLTWETLSETNNAGFDVQRRISTTSNAQSGMWTTLQHVRGAGTTSTPQNYRFTDSAIPFDANWITYRLRQIDIDGTTALSDEIRIRPDALKQLTLRPAYPNPVRESTTIEFGTPDARRVTLQLFDVMGRNVRTLFEADVVGRESVTIRTDGLASGLYFVRLQSEGQTRTERFVVVR
ncbi:hypothetical protein CRI94_14610 [Longibacter salinarum]|uniref:Secretion system C-terminal sorting domain-containing protein n=1 Tax=Longibacter salinarum TaxID=1850348 RepID=A0A2A8CUI1_9BACT|nr:T9SS type A sorting domain-containing protein [Longibacter salinarum]PEN12266.1 hypothetical protein CRI94_14610 [Longibacter salinarum]